MGKIIIGKYVNTHGIKGEIRIKSSFEYKDKIFKKGNKVFIDNHEYIINSYRVHKDYDMITLEGIDDINKISFKKNINVYIERDEYLDKNEYLDSDLIGFIVYNREIERELLDILYINDVKKLIKTREGYIPYELIKNVDLKNKKILIEDVDGL